MVSEPQSASSLWLFSLNQSLEFHKNKMTADHTNSLSPDNLSGAKRKQFGYDYQNVISNLIVLD